MSAFMPKLVDYPLRTYEKLRYADTDRQGHINNAIFSTMLETGRVELLCAPDAQLFDAGCAFVIARLQLDFHGEVTWPGQVDIGTRVAAIGRSSFTLEQGLFQTEKCVATAQTVIVQINERSRRSQRLCESAIRQLAELVRG